MPKENVCTYGEEEWHVLFQRGSLDSYAPGSLYNTSHPGSTFFSGWQWAIADRGKLVVCL